MTQPECGDKFPDLSKLGLTENEYDLVVAEFDADYYREHPSLDDCSDADAFEHFMTLGWKGGLDPNERFSIEAYSIFYPEIADTTENPFVHFILSERGAGFAAHSADILDKISSAALKHVRPFFDAAHYTRQINQADWTDSFALKHYMAYGWKDGFDPAVDFSTKFYLEDNEDIREAGLNPFLHYHIAGRREYRNPHQNATNRPLNVEEIEALSSVFDAEFYRLSNPELKQRPDEDLLHHYMTTGWHEGCDPSPLFSTTFYLETYSDIADADLNPLLHYAVAGRAEGRLARAEDVIASRLVKEMQIAAPHFDAKFYAQNNSELPDDEEELLKNYLTEGWKDGRDPSPNFSTNYYLEANEDIADAGIHPLIHYAIWGHTEGRKTHAVNENREFSVADLDCAQAYFDPDFYQTNAPELSGDKDDLLRHYLTKGWHENRDPSQRFSTSYYLEENADIRKAGLNPLLHYVIFGRSEGRKAYKHQLVSTNSKKELALVAPFFDADFYRRSNPDLDPWLHDEDLLVHYMEKGWKKGYDPSAEFSTSFYLDVHLDIEESKLNPLLHFASSGQAEGRIFYPDQMLERLSDTERAALDKLFDVQFYRSANRDITGSDNDLFFHYMRTGWREGRDPATDFSTRYYLETYEDVRLSLVNPLLHYAVTGKNEGRRPIAHGPVELGQMDDAIIVPDHLKCILGGALGAKKTSLPDDHIVNPGALDIHWVIPDFQRGGGGHMTIFRMIRYLELFGHTCTVWIDHPRVHKTADAAYQDIIKYFQCIQAKVAFVKEGLSQATGDVVIATGWSTAYLVEEVRGFAAKYYFVQDHEAEFFPTGTERLMALRTYEFEFASICASPWLAKIMSEQYGRWARNFYLAYDHEIYAIKDHRAHQARFTDYRTGPLKIAVYARGHTARRCVDLALLSLDLLTDQGLDFEVHFFGQDRLPFSATRFKAYDHGVLAPSELAQLYRECDLGVCFSATNYSLVPQEMMACGLPVVELDVGSTRETFPDGVVTLAGPDPADIADKLANLIADARTRKAQAKAALEWVGQFTWEKSARDVETALVTYLDQRVEMSAPVINANKSNLLDVIIPTYNGMSELEPVIDALRRQKHADQMQIFCIDSSSTDGTAEWLKDQKDISTTSIDQKTFQHGRTRNDAIALGSAAFVGVLTQDAMPATEFWATDILKMMHHYPAVAGLFGRHLPYPDHPEFVRNNINNHFQGMLNKPLVMSKFTDLKKWQLPDQRWHQFLHFYSDNNSAMRRSVWQKIPYPEIEYGEDQVWAYDIIKAGYSKLYAPTVAVYHSHDFDPDETYERSKTEGAFFHTYFGYELGQGTKTQVEKRVAHEQQVFERWALNHSVAPDKIERHLRNISEKHRGWCDGVEQSKAVRED